MKYIPDELKTIVNSLIKANGKKAITGTVLNAVLHHFIDSFAHIDTPIIPYSTTIADGDLDAYLSITINHGKGTTVPDFIVYNHNNKAIYSEYFTAEVIDEDRLKFSFEDHIPATGNGYYTVIIWKIIDQVDPYYTEIFYSDFSSWSEGIPDDWTTEEPELGGATIENDSSRCKFNNDAYGKVKILPDISLDIFRQYRISLKLDSGDLLVKSGFNQHIISAAGEYIFEFYILGTAELKFCSNTATTSILDWVKIESIS